MRCKYAEATWLANSRRSDNQPGPAQTEPMCIVGDKVPAVKLGNGFGTVRVVPPSGRGKPVCGMLLLKDSPPPSLSSPFPSLLTSLSQTAVFLLFPFLSSCSEPGASSWVVLSSLPGLPHSNVQWAYHGLLLSPGTGITSPGVPPLLPHPSSHLRPILGSLISVHPSSLLARL